MEWVQDNASWLSVAGICWDISGGVLLSKGLLMNDDQIRRRSGSYWGSSPPAVRGLCEQRIDAKLGLVQILFGFAIQLIAATGLTVSFGLGMTIILPIALVWHYYRRNFLYWVTVSSLRFVEDASESVWRKHFEDVSAPTWSAAARRVGVKFKEPT